jgi:hypothetical protein
MAPIAANLVIVHLKLGKILAHGNRQGKRQKTGAGGIDRPPSRFQPQLFPSSMISNCMMKLILSAAAALLWLVPCRLSAG